MTCFKEVFEAYKADRTYADIKNIMEVQGYSGMSWGLMCSLIYTFLDKDLADFLNGQGE